MAIIPNAPGMGVVPSAIDISRYNLWAARYGQPLWGANAAPAPPAAPAPAPQAGRGWQRGRPRGTPPPAPHGEPAAGPGAADDKWRPGTEEVGKKTYAYRATGRRLVVRIWNSITRQYRVTPNGEDYYRNNRQEFIFEIPAVGYVWSTTHRKEVVAFRKYINVTDPAMQAALETLDVGHQLYGLFGAGMVRDRLSGPAEVQAAITEAVHLYIERLGTDSIEGHKIVLHASDVTFCYDDTRPIRYSEQIVRHIRDDGTPVIENILDRPLQGFPALPPKDGQQAWIVRSRPARPQGQGRAHGGADL